MNSSGERANPSPVRGAVGSHAPEAGVIDDDAAKKSRISRVGELKVWRVELRRANFCEIIFTILMEPGAHFF